MNDELIARLLRYSRNCIAYRLDPDFADAVGEAVKALGSTRPVVQGKWVEDCTGAAICSACGEYAFETSTHHLCGWFPNFCPNCGADCRGDRGGK